LLQKAIEEEKEISTLTELLFHYYGTKGRERHATE